MATLRIEHGSWVVIATRNIGGAWWSCRLYVNRGDTATAIAYRCKTTRSVRVWAANQFERMREAKGI